MARTALTGTWSEGATLWLTGTINGPTGPLPNADVVLTAMTLTLYELTTGAIINGRDATNIKNANGGTVAPDGSWALTLSGADMACVLVTTSEKHIALIEWTDDAGNDGNAEIEFEVMNLQKVG